MALSLTTLIVWIIIAALVGIIGELIAGRRAPDGLLGAIIVGFLAIFIVVGILGLYIPGEPRLNGIPLISSIIIAALLVFIWSRFAYHHFHRRY